MIQVLRLVPFPVPPPDRASASSSPKADLERLSREIARELRWGSKACVILFWLPDFMATENLEEVC